MPESCAQSPSVAVVVPARDGGAKLNLCLASVARLSPAPAEVIVVADGDVNGCAEAAAAWNFTAVTLPVCSGPAAARNAGARRSTADVLFFVDADVLVPVDAVAKVTAALTERTEFAALIGSYDLEPTEQNFLSRYKNLTHHFVHQAGNEEAFVFWGACGAIRREVFFALGGFDETYTRPAIEDIELGHRLRREGHRILMHKALQVRHMKKWTTRSLVATDFLCRAVPWADLLRQSGDAAPDDLNLGRRSKVSVVCAFGLLVSLVAALRWEGALVVSGISALALLVLNARLYAFYRRQWGVAFMAGGIAWHWFYFLYGGLAYALVAAGLADDRWCGRVRRTDVGSTGSPPGAALALGV